MGDVAGPPLFTRWASKVLIGDDCWEWQAGHDAKGYGFIHRGVPEAGKERAHRYSYATFRGLIPDSLCVCHTCDNPACVKPSHLFLGTIADNNHDRDEKGRGNRPLGELNGNAKLAEGDVREIRRRLQSGEKQQVIADHYGLRQQTISEIGMGNLWRLR